MSTAINEMKSHLWQTLWLYNEQTKRTQCSSFEDFSDCFDEALGAMDVLKVLSERLPGRLSSQDLKANYAVETTYNQVASNWAEKIEGHNLAHIWNAIVYTLQFRLAMVNYPPTGGWVTVNPQQFFTNPHNYVDAEQSSLRLTEHMFVSEWYIQYVQYENQLRLQTQVLVERVTHWRNRWLTHSVIRDCDVSQGMSKYLEQVFPIIVARCTALDGTQEWDGNTFRDSQLEDEIARSRVYAHLSTSGVRDRLSLQKFDYKQLHWALRLLAMEYVGATENVLYYIGVNYALRTGKQVEMVFGTWGTTSTYMLLVDGKLYSFGQRGRDHKDMQIKHRWELTTELRQSLLDTRHHSRGSVLANVHYNTEWFFGIPPKTEA